MEPKSGRILFDLVDKKWVVHKDSVYAHDEYVLDRTRAAHIRKMLRPFCEYRDSVLRLRGGVHRAEYADEHRLCVILRNILVNNQPHDDARNDFMSEQTAYDDSILLKNAYLVGGAVHTEKVWNQPEKPNPYAGRVGIHYLRS